MHHARVSLLTAAGSLVHNRSLWLCSGSPPALAVQQAVCTASFSALDHCACLTDNGEQQLHMLQSWVALCDKTVHHVAVQHSKSGSQNDSSSGLTPLTGACPSHQTGAPHMQRHACTRAVSDCR